MDNYPDNSPDIALHQAEILLEEVSASYNCAAAKAWAADELINEALHSTRHPEAVQEKLFNAHLDASQARSIGNAARDLASRANWLISSVRPLPSGGK
jgi:hypothetical protein